MKLASGRYSSFIRWMMLCIWKILFLQQETEALDAKIDQVEGSLSAQIENLEGEISSVYIYLWLRPYDGFSQGTIVL